MSALARITRRDHALALLAAAPEVYTVIRDEDSKLLHISLSKSAALEYAAAYEDLTGRYCEVAPKPLCDAETSRAMAAKSRDYAAAGLGVSR